MVVLKIPKSGGVVTRGKAIRKQEHLNRVEEYFYGSVNGELKT